MWKTSKQCSKGIRDNSHQNLIFLKPKLVYKPNGTTNSTKCETELLYSEVGKAELNFMK
jgi:hypothetical protein